MKTARQLLAEKAIDNILSVTPQASVYQALQVLAEKNIGALLVMEENHLVGIFSERDYARKVILMGKTSAGTPVSEIMTRKLLCVPPSATIDECMAIMSEKRIRHLPVLDGDKVLGVLSIGDLVREIIEEQKFTIAQLEHYIHS
ncbi:MULTISPECIES: CBS domain-containing protein [Betaproteobacteria]|jgi:CBS domain-containing protein|uniref:CBS domain-containing protein n=1 Tax=Betaproteobacteria TaxID=28216 RepID=UPI00061D2AC9|nr:MULTISPECIES: CBS domain-containing protein [Betaproteobacteria]AMC35687.1 histidine kinase [Janthinobacterium sp. B9-8]MDW5415962.1 CBS domain-containing protein [Iodobacter sp. CM08]